MAVELLDAEDRPQASGAASFKVSSTGLPGFWVYGPSNPGPEDASYDYRLGTQFLVVGDAAKARDALERAHAKAPQSLEYATAYGQALLAAGDAAKALEILRPLAAEGTGDYDLFAVAGRAAQDGGGPQGGRRILRESPGLAGADGGHPQRARRMPSRPG